MQLRGGEQSGIHQRLPVRRERARVRLIERRDRPVQVRETLHGASQLPRVDARHQGLVEVPLEPPSPFRFVPKNGLVTCNRQYPAQGCSTSCDPSWRLENSTRVLMWKPPGAVPSRPPRGCGNDPTAWARKNRANSGGCCRGSTRPTIVSALRASPVDLSCWRLAAYATRPVASLNTPRTSATADRRLTCTARYLVKPPAINAARRKSSVTPPARWYRSPARMNRSCFPDWPRSTGPRFCRPELPPPARVPRRR